ncbi:MAG: SRPBCC family protein, partial [Gammaproteobacteria bacterium]
LTQLDLDQAERVREADLHASCNWKYALDTYFENYHFATLHKSSIGPLFVNNLILYDTWGPHHRVVFPPRETWDWVKKPESEWLIDTLGTPYFIFPNTIVFNGSLRPDCAYLTVFRIYPRGVGELVTRTAIYAPYGVASEAHRKEVHEALDGILHLVQDEDYDVTSESWKNFLALPRGTRVVYGRQELAVQHAHLHFARAIGMPEPDVVPAAPERPPAEVRLRA